MINRNMNDNLMILFDRKGVLLYCNMMAYPEIRELPQSSVVYPVPLDMYPC
jgi:hypothetical protein